MRKAPKKFRFAVRRFTRPDLSGWAGRVDSRDRAVGCAAQEIFMMALRAAGRRIMNTGVHPRHFSSGFYLAFVRACVCANAARRQREARGGTRRQVCRRFHLYCTLKFLAVLLNDSGAARVFAGLVADDNCEHDERGLQAC